jgi:hypothetical protein
MKLSKTLVLTATTLAVFGIGHVRALVTHGQFGCAVAAAASWDDGSSAADDDATAPDDDAAATPDKHKVPPPDIAGAWGGTLDDFDLGDGGVEMEIKQKGTKLSGPWSSDFGGRKFTGSIDSDDDIKMNLKAGKGGCHLSAVGQLVTEGEIEMTYRVKSCKGVSKHDFGSIQLFAAP